MTPSTDAKHSAIMHFRMTEEEADQLHQIIPQGETVASYLHALVMRHIKRKAKEAKRDQAQK